MIIMIHLYIMFQQVEDYTAMNMQKYSNMPKKKIKVVSEVSIWINHNFSHEFNDDVNEWSAVQWKINIITEHQNIGTLADNYM